MVATNNTPYKKFYDDPKFHCTTMFFNGIREKLRKEHRVLNLGAGPKTGDANCIQRDEAAELVGADIDPIVLDNDELDSAVLIEDGRLPFDDDYFDLVFSVYVLEHVAKPHEFLSEVLRALKPGGSYFFRTPNMYHYVAIIS